MKVLDKLLALSLMCASSVAQLPFFLQRFRPTAKPHHGLLASPSYPSSFFALPSSFLGSSSGSASSPFATSGQSFASSPFSAQGSSLSPHFSSPSLFAPSQFGSSSHFGDSPNKFAASNLALDFGSAGQFEGGFDHADLLEDYPGFSNAGFAKELNFAGSQVLGLQSNPSTSYTATGPYLYLQREADK